MLDGRNEDWLFAMCVAFIAATAIGCGGDSIGEDPGGGYNGGGYNGGGDYGANNTLGATVGGAQDIAYARALIEAGSIPPAESITVEGLFSEHDLPVMGKACDQLLCLRPAAATAPNLATGQDDTWIHLGMKSGLPRDFVRPPLDTVVVIDKSSAMDIDMTETNDAVVDILEQLRDGDRLSVVVFDDTARTLIAPTAVEDLDRGATEQQVRAIVAAGGANLMAGLQQGYDLARQMESGTDRMSRVIVLSCGYPNVGTTDPDSFVGVVQEGADDGIGMTFLGVLLSFDYRLAERLSSVRGGNYYYVDDLTRLEQLFEEDFDSMVTPLAYDLEVKLGVDPNQWNIAQVYGLPGEPGASSAGFDVTTAFVSNRGGGMVVRLAPATSSSTSTVAQVGLSYTPEAAHGWSATVSQLEPLIAGDDIGTAGVRKSVALVNMAEQMRTAIESDDRAPLLTLRTYLQAEATALADPDLAKEVELIEKLIELL